MRRLVTVLCALAIGTAAAAQTAKSPQKPGRWQVKMEMDMPGVPFKMPAINTETCITEEQLADPNKTVPRDPKSDCTVSDYKVKGDTVSWTMECKKQKMSGSGEITYTGDSYTGTMKMKMDTQEMTMKYTGKYLGACTK